MGKYKYRIKTLEEFKKDVELVRGHSNYNAHDLRNIIGFNNDGMMDYLFGKYIDIEPKNLSPTGEVKGYFNIEDDSSGYTWGLSYNMVVRENAHPQYNKRKLIY